jgi:exodeoxyribonuclease-3
MKIAAFNINNIRRRLPNLLDWMRETGPDVVCLQELKATDAEFPIAAVRNAGYEAIWRGQKTWNGVAILSRVKPIQTLSDLPGAPDDKQSGYIEAAVNGIVVASLYAPNGNPQPGPKFDYKLAWLRRLSVHAAEAFGRPSTRRACRGLQRGSDRPGHLSLEVMGQGRAGSAGEPGCLC